MRRDRTLLNVSIFTVAMLLVAAVLVVVFGEFRFASASTYHATFTDAEWATLEKTFATGVCDYSKPGVNQRPVVPWLTYSDAHGRVIYGGKPLGSAPVSKAFAK